jgi:putative chitinase
MGIKLTSAILMAGTGCSAAIAGAWLAPMQAACDEFGVSDTPARVAAFLANVGVESNGLTVFVENLNYSAQGLANTWPGRYAVGAHVLQKVPNQLAYQLGGKPQAIANNVYANRLGNGPESSGDGWKFRGQGPIQLTGHDNILKFFAAAGLPLQTDPAELQRPVLGSKSAAWFFSTSGAFAYADEGNFDCTVKSVNGQVPCQENQGDRRNKLYQAALPLAQAAAKPAAPVPAPKKAPVAPATATDKP